MEVAMRLLPIVALPLLTAGAALAEPPPSTPFTDLAWRSLGPFRGGWSTCVEGIPSQPNVFYFGAAGGGLWRTDDAGLTWQPLFQHEATASVGALALAPSHPSTLYVGTGQVDTRYDVASGAGVFRSDDEGRSWRGVGLADSRAIGRIWVDPQQPNVVVVAALGHLFAPHPERGVFRSEDGGKSWQKTLFVDADTGAVDLAGDPEDASVLYAATWQARNYPWLSYFRPEKGPGSGVFKSRDGGRTWRRLRGKGWPAGDLGRIGLATAGHRRVYALVDARSETPEAGHPERPQGDGGLYRSDDGGESWARVAQADWLESSYFGRLTADPRNPDRLYVMGQSVRRSDDGGRSFEIVKGAPGGDDYHFLWINPVHPDHLALASDQGTSVSVNGGATWSGWYNQPTGQFYRLAVDHRFPYWIYSGQQDSGTVAIRSRGDYGGVGWREWHPVGADERDQDIPDPSDPEIVYGAGLGGALNRFDGRTGQSAPISPHLESTYGLRPSAGKYRYTWYTPLAVSRRPPYSLFLGAQVLFRSLDRGVSWSVASPDLSRATAGATGCSGDLSLESAAACGYGVIHSIALSARSGDEIWVGTDDGRVRVTRNGGRTWDDRTPRELQPWSTISSLELSPLEAGVAYAAVDAHRLDDFRPHLLRTRDGGQSWVDISHGLPSRGFATVLRADPQKKGLLFAGTEMGVYVSTDNGDHWESLQLNLPTVTATDLLVQGTDLIASTQGRGLWLLDDVSPLRQDVLPAGQRPRLLRPADAYRIREDENHDTPLPQEIPVAPNPPAGAVIDYLLPASAQGPVRLDILDSHGKTVRSFSSDDSPPSLPAERYFTKGWLRAASSVSREPGHHRFVWDLRLPRPKAARYEYSIAATWGEDTPAQPLGALALPGSYSVRLTEGADSATQPLILRMDPRVHASREMLARQLDVAQRTAAAMEQAFAALEEVKQFRSRWKGSTPELFLQSAGFEEGPQSFLRLNERLAEVFRAVEAADVAPTAVALSELDATQAELARTLSRWKALTRGGE
jgi:photosystem II stability/assembly factor-like uncharacterized protein